MGREEAYEYNLNDLYIEKSLGPASNISQPTRFYLEMMHQCIPMYLDCSCNVFIFLHFLLYLCATPGSTLSGLTMLCQDKVNFMKKESRIEDRGTK